MPSCVNLTRRTFLAGVAAAGAGAKSSVAGNRPAGVPFGAAIEARHLDDARYRALFAEHCDIVLPMNELKFGLVHPEPGRFDFSGADRVIDFVEARGKRSRGHAVVWWNEVPPWLGALSDAKQAERALREHVEAVVGRYAGRLESWDVVNEAVAHEAPFEAPLRDTVWQRLLGPRHIPLAFRAVAAVDPKARLVLNDYDLEFRGARHDRRRAVILEIVRQLRGANVAVHAVGLQGHLYADQAVDVDALGRFGEALKQEEVGLLVTELDVIDWKIDGGAAAQDAAAAKAVQDLMDGVFAAGDPEAVIAWGLSDRYSWVDDAMPHANGTPSRPLPFDRDYRAKRWFAPLRARLRGA